MEFPSIVLLEKENIIQIEHIKNNILVKELKLYFNIVVIIEIMSSSIATNNSLELTKFFELVILKHV